MSTRRRMMMMQQSAPKEYIQDGLVFWLDGIDKGATDGSWVDLIGGLVFENVRATAIDNCFIFNGSQYLWCNRAISIGSMEYCTLEIDCELSSLNSSNEFNFAFCNNSGTYDNQLSPSIAFSKTNLHTFVCGAQKAFRAELNVGVIQSSFTSKNVLFNGIEYGITSKGVYSNGGSHPTIGTRAMNSSKSSYHAESTWHGKIYSIRLYNRILSNKERKHNAAYSNIRFNLGL